MKLQKLLFGIVIFLMSFNVLVSCTDTADDDYQDQIELYGTDKENIDPTKQGGQGGEDE
ncbi:hypothetical protein ACFQ1M_06735 [Sungkyunkwania multivorans]|uniref:Secreted protein n=1 Tax=Sungkyunkwania multivorans TaxID=1173618 RepID=A0ABW3CVS8_9FLAO